MEHTLRQMAQTRRQSAEKLGFLDAEIWLGASHTFPLAKPLGPEQLAATIGKDFIRGGLVSHWRGLVVSPQEGNRALEAIAPDLPDQTYTVWTGLPLYPVESGLVPGHGDLPEKMRGVRIYPRSQHFPLADWMIGSLCRWLVEHRLPLFIWHVELDWSSLRSLAQAFPALTIIVETQTQKILYHTRPLFALMRECRNVLVELSNFIGVRFIEYAVQEYGAERLVFGSFQPMNDPRVPIGMILDAQISDAEKAMIAGGNLRKLIDQVEP